MATVRLLPGYGQLNETVSAEQLLPGYGQLNETVSALPTYYGAFLMMKMLN